MTWIYAWDSLISEEGSVDGVSLLDATNWTRVENETANVVDPLYGNREVFPIYTHTKSDGKIVRVAFQERSPGVHIAFVESESVLKTVRPQPSRLVKFR